VSQPELKQRQRRVAPRRKPKGGTRIACRKGSMGLGPNLAQALLDLSEGGVRLLLGAALAPGQEVEVSLSAPGVTRDVKRLGEVAWCIPAAPGGYCVGIRFTKRLDHATLRDLSQFHET
jgi:hypothetical protein